MKLWPFALLLAVALPASAEAQRRQRPCDEGRLGHLENALIGDRLIQSERMIETLRADCNENGRFAALNARFALQSGRHADAYGLYAALAAREPANIEFAAGAGRSALHLGRDDEAFEYLRRATASPEADWRAWNAIGILHDRRRQWVESEQAMRGLPSCRLLRLGLEQSRLFADPPAPARGGDPHAGPHTAWTRTMPRSGGRARSPTRSTAPTTRPGVTTKHGRLGPPPEQYRLCRLARRR